MRRQQGQYSDSGVNLMGPAQMQQMQSQRVQLQHSHEINQFSGRPNSMSGEEDHHYVHSKGDDKWQWSRDGTRGSNQLPSRAYGEDARFQAREQEKDVFEDNSLGQTFEGLEKNFFEDIMNLAKEQTEAEDSENARHRERLSEINSQYQEKLFAMRARQAAQRDEILHRESQARYQQYHQANLNNYPNSTAHTDSRGFASSAAATAEESHQGHSGGHIDSYSERSQFSRSAQGRELESRGPYPGGRAYNSGGRYF